MTGISAPPRLHVVRSNNPDPIMREEADVCLHADWSSAVRCVNERRHDWTWHFIVSSDLRPCRGWMQHLERAVLNSPRQLLGLISHDDAGVINGAPYVVSPTAVTCSASAYHHSLFPDLAKFSDRVVGSGYRGDWLGAWAGRWKNFEPASVARSLFDAGTYTIENSPGPDWSVRPASVRLPPTTHSREALSALLSALKEAHP